MAERTEPGRTEKKGRKLLVRNYEPETFLCLMEDAATKKKHLFRIRFYYVYRAICPGTAFYAPDAFLNLSGRIDSRMTYGPTGLSPLAEEPAPEDDLLLAEFDDGTQIPLQRYAYAVTDVIALTDPARADPPVRNEKFRFGFPRIFCRVHDDLLRQQREANRPDEPAGDGVC